MDGIDVFWFKLSLISIQLTLFVFAMQEFHKSSWNPPLLFIFNLPIGLSIPFTGGIILIFSVHAQIVPKKACYIDVLSGVTNSSGGAQSLLYALG